MHTIESQISLYKQYVDLQVNAAGATVKSGAFEITSSAKTVIGIAATTSHEPQLYLRGSQSIKINDQEVFPEGYESRFFMFGLSTDLDKRFKRLNIPTGNRQVEIVYKDTNVTTASFAPYTVRFYIFSSPEEHVED